ncbi:hypothetical protein IFM89_009248 [Coptis chinensis]|uniref:Chaperone DnaJ C-terminal domain-containing protein n=1 Tax=Coptis chinensis TaxID=261450 RepID=A0A835IBN3_9MAGN|nr:hypothetical protein IFM89_009248 [Coptis chinensis]
MEWVMSGMRSGGNITMPLSKLISGRTNAEATEDVTKVRGSANVFDQLGHGLNVSGVTNYGSEVKATPMEDAEYEAYDSASDNEGYDDVNAGHKSSVMYMEQSRRNTPSIVFDMYVEHSLSLTEALCGFQFVLTHLDNKQLIIKSNPGEVVKPDQFKAINDEGMPMYQRPFMRGKLYIHFTVEFPDSLTTDQSKALETVLPPRASTQLTDMEVDECEETTLHDVNIEEQMRRKQAHSREANDDDEESHRGAQRVQCTQQ